MPFVDSPLVVLVQGMSLDRALHRLKRQTEAAQLGREVRRRQAAESPGQRRRRKHRAALKRAAKARAREAGGS